MPAILLGAKASLESGVAFAASELRLEVGQVRGVIEGLVQSGDLRDDEDMMRFSSRHEFIHDPLGLSYNRTDFQKMD